MGYIARQSNDINSVIANIKTGLTITLDLAPNEAIK